MSNTPLSPDECLAVISALGHDFVRVANETGLEVDKIRRVRKNKKYIDYRVVDKLREYVKEHEHEVRSVAKTLHSALKE